MHDVALGAGQADVFQTRSSSLRTRVKDVVTRAAPGAYTRRSGPPAGATPVLLEERQVGQGPPAHGRRHPRFLGVFGLPQLRRPLARATLPGRLARGPCSCTGLSGASRTWWR